MNALPRANVPSLVVDLLAAIDASVDSSRYTESDLNDWFQRLAGHAEAMGNLDAELSEDPSEQERAYVKARETFGRAAAELVRTALAYRVDLGSR